MGMGSRAGGKINKNKYFKRDNTGREVVIELRARAKKYHKFNRNYCVFNITT